jgi:hypothetical protein
MVTYGIGQIHTASPVATLRVDGGDDVVAELEAILAVGKALARLRNEDSCRRVLNWAGERFITQAQAQAIALPPSPAPDATLLVDDLEDFFDWRHDAMPRTQQQTTVDDVPGDLFDSIPASRPDAPVDPPAVPHAETPSAVRVLPFEAPRAVRVVREPEPRPLSVEAEDTPLTVRDEPALDVLVTDFVNDFRRLAVEWPTA